MPQPALATPSCPDVGKLGPVTSSLQIDRSFGSGADGFLVADGPKKDNKGHILYVSVQGFSAVHLKPEPLFLPHSYDS